MSDAQFVALLGALTTFLGALITTAKWAVNRITKALDDNSAAQIEASKQMAILATKIDHVYLATERVRDFVTEERSGVHEAPPQRLARARTKSDPLGHPTGEYHVARPKTRDG